MLLNYKPFTVLEALITSKTRIRLLLKFFLNSDTTSYLRDLAGEFNESTNAIRVELNHLENAGLLYTEMQGNRKVFRANPSHPLFDLIRQLLLRHTGIDQIVESVLNNLQGLQSAWVTGNFARGKDGDVIDVLLAGNELDLPYLEMLTDKAENLIGRKIRFVIIKPEEKVRYLQSFPEALLLWKG